MKINISLKLTISILLITLILVIIDLLMVFTPDSVNRLAKDMGEKDIPAAILSLNMLEEMGDLNSNTLEYVLGEKDEVEDFEKNAKQFEDYFSKLRALELSPSEQLMIEELGELYESYTAGCRNIFKTFDPDKEIWAKERGEFIELNYSLPMEELIEEAKISEVNDAGSSGNFYEVINDDLPGVRYYLEMLDEADDMFSTLIEYLSGEAEEREDFEANAKEFLEYYTLLLPLERRPNEVAALTKIKTLYDSYVRDAIDIFENYDPTTKLIAIEEVDRLEHEYFDKIEDFIDELSEAKDKRVKENSKKMMANMTSLIIIITILTIISVIFGIIMLIINRRTIVLPVRSAVDILGDIASGQGDLSKELQINSQDELGQMSKNFNSFIISLNDIISEIKKATNNLFEIGDVLAINVEKTTSAISQITSNIESTQKQIGSQESSVNETSVAIEEIVHNIESLNNMIEEQAAAVAQSSSSIEQMIANISLVTNNIEKLSDLFKKLLQSSESGKEKISNVNVRVQEIAEQSESLLETNQIISGIAEQTDLLAINAAIEAAHAGESGKGFAVVADEIRQLAETATIQSREIESKLKKIKSIIDNIVLASSEAEVGFNSVVNLITSISNLETEINTAMKEQQSGSVQILETLSAINTITTNVREGSYEMKQRSNQIIKEVTTLSATSSEVVTSISEISKGSNEINESVTNIRSITNKNTITIKKVVDIISKFKLKDEKK